MKFFPAMFNPLSAIDVSVFSWLAEVVDPLNAAPMLEFNVIPV